MADTINIVIQEQEAQTNVVIEQATTTVNVSVSDIGIANDVFTAYSGEAIPSYTPVAIVNGIVYRYDAADITHLMAFSGFSLNGVSNSGEVVSIKQDGVIEFAGWGLTQGQHYLSGLDGAISLTQNPSALFKRIVGYAQTSSALNILKFNPIINT